MDELLTNKFSAQTDARSALKKCFMPTMKFKKKYLKLALLPLMLALVTQVAWADSPKATLKTPTPTALNSAPIDIDARLKTLSAEMKVPLSDLNAAKLEAKKIDSILKTMDRPWEAKPWYKYWPIFIIPKRIDSGVEFWQQNDAALKEAFRVYGVPPEIVLAIIGVETFYGKNMGSFRVLDALYTLGFYYPKRADYFSREFVNYVRLATREGWAYGEIKGSYAGAMGMGQFMPWSYLSWAIDFNHNGHINLFKENEDVIGSVANYFKEHGWDRNAHSVYKMHLTPEQEAIVDTFLTDGLELKIKVQDLRKAGLKIPAYYTNDEPCKVIKLEEEQGFTYYLGFQNFKAITGYNRSPLYAMTVYLLSREIRFAHDKTIPGPKVKSKVIRK